MLFPSTWNEFTEWKKTTTVKQPFESDWTVGRKVLQTPRVVELQFVPLSPHKIGVVEAGPSQWSQNFFGELEPYSAIPAPDFYPILNFSKHF